MLLAIDIGNTNIVAGVFDGDTLVTHWRMATDMHRMADEYAVLMQSLFRAAGLDPAEISGVAVCGVVPPVLSALLEAIRRYWKLEPVVVSPLLDLGMEVRYSPPHGVGADRIANAVAVIHLFGKPAIVVDFGTSTNFDVISETGAYIGGALAPGLEISEEALIAHTAQLPRIPLEAPASAIGTNTIAALQSGILFGYAGLVDGLVGRISGELGGNPHVVATGGLAGLIAPHTSTVQHVDPNLTLVGLQLLYMRNRNHAHAAGSRQD